MLKDEGVAGLDAIVKAVDADEAEVKATLSNMVDVGHTRMAITSLTMMPRLI